MCPIDSRKLRQHLLYTLSRIRLDLLTKDTSANRFLQTGHAIVYAFALLVAPVSHAILEASDFEEIHVESESFEHGQQPHDEYMCQACRLVEVGGAKSQHVAFVEVASLLTSSSVSYHYEAEQTGLSRLHPSRAPPAR